MPGFALVNVGFAIIFPDKCNDVEKKIIFDDLNTERLRIAVRGNAVEAETFYFDPNASNGGFVG